MRQLSERKHGMRIIVFALLLTMLAWLAPVNVGVVKAADGDMEKIPVDGGGYLLFDKDKSAITGCEGNITEVDLSKIAKENDITITTIGENAFKDCSRLTSVTIPNSVITIENYAFYGCSGLTSVTIPNSVTTIGAAAFQECRGLTSISIPNSVTTIGYGAFEFCSSLTSVSIPDSVIIIGNAAFYGCGGLTSVTIPNGVTIIGAEAFEQCKNLTSVTISDSVTSIGREAFGYQWSELNGDFIPIRGFKIYGYSNDSAAAQYAKDNEFEYVIVGSEGINPDQGNQEENNNQGGNSSDQGNQNDNTSNNKGNNDQNNVPAVPDKPAPVTTQKGTTVKDKKSNSSYVVTQTKKNGGTVSYKNPVDKKKSNVTIPGTVKIEGKTYKVIAIEKNAFKGNQNLKTVKIGSNIEKIGANAFNKCTKLKTVKLPGQVKTIQKGAFANCKNLKTITIQTKKLTKGTVGAGAFKGVNSKATVKVPKGKAKAYQKLLRSKGLSKKAKVK